MSTNQTPNYQLSQWEAGDQVQRADFNADNAKIDEVLKAHADALLGKGNCRIEAKFVNDGVIHNASTPLVIQFSAVPAFFVLFDGSSVAFGLGGAKNAPVVVNGQYNAGMTSLSVSWSGSTATIRNPQSASSYTQYSVAAFYAQ